MLQLEALAEVVSVLERLGLPWMIVGSYAASRYGDPRFTNDIDIVVAYTATDAGRIVQALGDGFYASEEMLVEGLQRGTMSNVIHLQTMVKLDLCPPRDTEYDRVSLARRLRDEFDGVCVWVQTPEDTILSKLLWARESLSERQFRDIRGILRTRSDLDWQYLRQWAQRLGVAELLERTVDEANTG